MIALLPWLARLLPVWRFLKPLAPYITLAIGALLLALWLDHRGYRRAMADRDKRDAAMLVKLTSELRRTEQRLAGTIHKIDATVGKQIAGIDAVRTNLQPIIEREIIREKRLADPAAGLTLGLLEAINRARSTGACAATVDGGIICALPATAANP